jgi:hypothetical protein
VVALWIVSRTTGLPLGLHPGAPEALGFPDVTATLFEAVLVGCAAWSLRPGRAPSRRAVARLAWALPLAVSPATIAAIVIAVGTTA